MPMNFIPPAGDRATPYIMNIDMDIVLDPTSDTFHKPKQADFGWLLLRLPVFAATDDDDDDPFSLTDDREQNIPGTCRYCVIVLSYGMCHFNMTYMTLQHITIIHILTSILKHILTNNTLFYPGWSPFNAALQSDDVPTPCVVRYCQTIDTSPTELSTVYTLMKRSI